jgi:lipopolysaccharide transport protein LptA
MNSRILTVSLAVLAALYLCCSTDARAADKEETVKTTINADKLEYDIEENVAYLRGSVVVQDGSGSLRADNATVYFKEKKDEKETAAEKKEDKTIPSKNPKVGDFYRVVALGNVLITIEDRQVSAQKAIWDRKTNKIILTGGPPMAKQGLSLIRATRIVYNVETQTIEFYPDPEVVLNPSDADRKKFVY